MEKDLEAEDVAQKRIALVSFPWTSSYKFLLDILKILEPISDKIVLINGNTIILNITSEKVEVRDIGIRIHYLKEIRPTIYSVVLWLAKCALVQIRASIELIRVRRKVDIVFFYIIYPYYLLPLITSKILRKKTIEVVTRNKPNSSLSKILSLQDPLLFWLLDGISPESGGLIKDLGLDKYKKKILPEGARFIDASRYTIKKKYNERKNIIGFIGRIKREKGIMEFIEAIPYMVEKIENIEFLIGGDGDLREEITIKCNKIKKDLGINITITGWIGDNLPDYLNELKLLILPSYSDAFPTIILEAMACGTPVLATSIGGIPDLLKEEETGFILKNNSPDCISITATRILKNSHIDKVISNARAIIEKKFTYSAAIERYRKILAR